MLQGLQKMIIMLKLLVLYDWKEKRTDAYIVIGNYRKVMV